MRRVHSGRHANEDAVFVIASTVQSARPDWLWSGTGFRLDDRVYREDRVTHPLKLQQDSPPHTLTGTDSALHYAILCVLFLPLSLLSPPSFLPTSSFPLLLLSLSLHSSTSVRRPPQLNRDLATFELLLTGSRMSWLSRLNPRAAGRSGRTAAPSSLCTADPETCLMVFENHWRQVSWYLLSSLLFFTDHWLQTFNFFAPICSFSAHFIHQLDN